MKVSPGELLKIAKQESIPVGCIMPALHRMVEGGFSDRDPLEGTWNQRQRPPEGTWDQAARKEVT